MEQSPKLKQEEGSRRRMLLFLVAMVCLITWMMSSGGPAKQHDCSREVAEFERVLHKKEKFLREEISKLEIEFQKEAPMDVLGRNSSRYRETSINKNISIFYYEGNELKYWSDHIIAIDKEWKARLSKPFLALRNADYVTVVSQTGEGILLGLIEIRRHYLFQNEFLVNGFQKDFALGSGGEYRVS